MQQLMSENLTSDYAYLTGENCLNMYKVKRRKLTVVECKDGSTKSTKIFLIVKFREKIYISNKGLKE